MLVQNSEPKESKTYLGGELKLKSKHLSKFASHDTTPLAAVKKGMARAIVFSKKQWKGTDYYDLRTYIYSETQDKYVPTPKGIQLTYHEFLAISDMMHEEFNIMCNDEEGCDDSVIPIKGRSDIIEGNEDLN